LDTTILPSLMERELLPSSTPFVALSLAIVRKELLTATRA
jgi:hypothetical protein